ncbi:hypothetical protein ACFVW8_07705 [Streptomyces sp. NPDC058221]
MSVAAGRLGDRYGPFRLLVIGVLGCGATLAALPLLTARLLLPGTGPRP